MKTILLAIASLTLGCSGNGATCGPGAASDDGLLLVAGGSNAMYESLTAGANGDCPATDAPAGVTSLTITGNQEGSGSELITLCIPRPDQLDTGTHALGLDGTTAEIRIVDLNASVAGCTLAIDTTSPPTGTVTGAGVCGNGTDSHGFALTFMGAVQMTRTCGTTVDTVAASLTGSVAVTPGT